MIKPLRPFSSPPSECNQGIPQTVDEAVEQLLEMLHDWDDLPLRPGMDNTAMECLHVSLRPHIRNTFGLEGKNPALLKDCGVDHADDAYVVILDALTKKLAGRERRRE